MTAVVAMVFTAGAFACGSALVVLRERAESPTEVTFANDFDRDDVGLSIVHGEAAAPREISVDAVDTEPSPTCVPDLPPVAVVSSLNPLTVGLVEVPETVEPLLEPAMAEAPDLALAAIDEPAAIAAPEHGAPPAPRKNALAQFRIPRLTFTLPARELRAAEPKRGPMLRNFLERFTRKRAAGAVAVDEPLFTLDPGVAQRPYVEDAVAELPAPLIETTTSQTAENSAPTAGVFAVPAPVLASVTAHTQADEDEPDDELDSVVDEISPERRAELDRAATAVLAARRDVALEPMAEPVAIAQRAAETVHALAREAQARDAEASRWASDLTGATRPVPIEKRRRLLKFYILSCDRPESRAILERVMREDPDLASEAEAALNKAA